MKSLNYRGLYLTFFVLLWLSFGWPQIFHFVPSNEAFAAQLKSVQSGTTTFPWNSTSVTAPITSVDTTKAFLVFGVSEETWDPQYGQISGQITNSTTITFQRAAAIPVSGYDFTLKWYVAEFTSGVSVQRGSQSMFNVTTANVPLTSVNTAKSFPVISFRTGGTTYDSADFVKAKITSNTNLQLALQTAGEANSVVEWQVVEYTDANVQSGDISFAAGDSTLPATITSVNTSKSWLVYTYNTANGTAANIGQKLVRGLITDATTLTFDRNNTGQTMNLTWYLVEFTDGTTVQMNTQNFTTTATQNNVTINSVDTTWAIATGGYFMRGGKSTYAGNDNAGVGWFRFDLTSATNLSITRGVTQFSTADVGWFVIQFVANPTAVKLKSFTANQYDDRVLLRWKTGYEIDNLGFHVYREENGELVRLTPEPVAGSALLAGSRTALTAGHHYHWWDFPLISTRPSSLATLKYWLEDIDLSGKRTMHGPAEMQPLVISDQLSVSKMIKPELLSEIGWRLQEKYHHYWKVRELKEKLRQKSSVISHRSSAIKVASNLKAEGRSSILKPLGGGAQDKSFNSTLSLQSRYESIPTPSLDTTVQQSLASRPAVKLLIKEEGWYRVGQSELVAAGLNSKVNPKYLQLYGGGQEQPIRVMGGKDGRFGSGDAIEFYGVGLDTSSTDTRVYWLVEGIRPGKRVDEYRSQGGQISSSSFLYTAERRDRVIYLAALKNGDEENFFGPIIYMGRADQLLSLRHLDPAPPEDALLEVSLQGATDVSHRVRVLFNEVEMGEIVFKGQTRGVLQVEIPHSLLLEGENLVSFIPEGGEMNVSLIDTIRLTYWHTYRADNNGLRFRAQGGNHLTVNGFSNPRIRVIDITEPNNPIEVLGKVGSQEGGYSVTFRTSGMGLRTLLAFTEEGAKYPDGIVANRPSSWNQSKDGYDLVMIAHRDFFGSFQPLKSLRESQGLSVALIDVEDLYDEFSFGNKTPLAIKSFLSLAKGQWHRPPRFVLLVGDASFDPRNYMGFGDFDFVPTKLIDTQYLETASDDWFVDFDNNGLPEMAVGRLPVQTVEEAGIVVSKIVGYEKGGRVNEALLVADRLDKQDEFNFEAASEEVRALLPSSIIVRKVYRGQFSNDAQVKGILLSSINEGPLLVNFIGHGSVGVWRGDFLTSEDAENLSNAPRLPFFVNMTCLNGFFQAPYADTLAEALLKAPQGGAIAVWTSSGLTEPDKQAVMNKELIKLLFGRESLTLGEATAKAKASVSDQDIRKTWILFGDPSTRLKP